MKFQLLVFIASRSPIGISSVITFPYDFFVSSCLIFILLLNWSNAVPQPLTFDLWYNTKAKGICFLNSYSFIVVLIYVIQLHMYTLLLKQNKQILILKASYIIKQKN